MLSVMGITPTRPEPAKSTAGQRAARHVPQLAFRKAYAKVILDNAFFELPSYYREQRSRYRRTLDRICRLPLPKPAQVVEIGGGQLALLMAELFGDACSCGDLYDTYASSLLRHGVEFFKFDLVRDEPPARQFDLLILLEVVEHLPIPPYVVLEKLRRMLRPGGILFLTTPNLYRFRNLVRMALGKQVFDHFLYPEPGQSIGHLIEYSEAQLRWQLERAGYSVISTELAQLSNQGSSCPAKIGRFLSSPLLLRPLWRDNLIAVARNPG